MKPVIIPSLIDDFPQVMLWSVDEIVPVMLGMLAGVLLNQAVLGLLFGLIIAKIYKKIKAGKNDGFLAHLLWRYIFIQIFKGKAFVEPLLKRMKP